MSIKILFNEYQNIIPSDLVIIYEILEQAIKLNIKHYTAFSFNYQTDYV